MDLTAVKQIVQDTPHMSLAKARTITSFIREHDLRDILELGFRFGVSTTYMAGALQDLDGGHITAIDLEIVRDGEENIERFLDEAGLRSLVTVHYEPTSYTWRLMRMLEEDTGPRFDFCYLDGAHDWFVDGFAFFLVDRLLRPGGWIIFDDLDWTFASSGTLSQTERVRAMPDDERVTPQVRKVYELLVKTHPSYGNFQVVDDWAYAQKLRTPAASGGQREVVREVVVQRERYGLGAVVVNAARRARRRLAR
jgi:predicted O-methyltransferase YrrM